jgi:hypothetical protein
MTKGAKGRGDAAPPAKPSPLAELRRRWPNYAKHYAKPFALLEKARLPVKTDKLLLAKKMIEALKNCERADHPNLPHDFLDMAREISKDAKSATKNAQELARFLRRYKRFPLIESVIKEAAERAGVEDGRFPNVVQFAATLNHLAESLPELATRGDGHRTRYGIRYRESLLRKGLPPDRITACLFAMVFHARQATGPARDAWARNESAAIFGPMPKDGNPLYSVAAAFVSAGGFEETSGGLGAKKAADRLATFMRRNPGAEYRGFRMVYVWPE